MSDSLARPESLKMLDTCIVGQYVSATAVLKNLASATSHYISSGVELYEDGSAEDSAVRATGNRRAMRMEHTLCRRQLASSMQILP